MKIVLDDEIHALLILSYLSDNQEILVISLSNSNPYSILSLSMIKDSLFNKKIRRKDTSTSDEHVLIIENKEMSMSEDSKTKEKGKVLPLQQGRSQRKYFWDCTMKQMEEKNQKKVNDQNTTYMVSNGDVLVISLGEEE